MSSDFHFLVPESFQQSFIQISTVVSEKIRFEFLYVHDLGPRSRNDLDLQYSNIFIYSIRCLLLPTFRSLAAITSEKSTFSLFLRKSGLNFCMYTTLGQGQEMTLTFNTQISSYIQLDVCSYQLSGHWLQ